MVLFLKLITLGTAYNICSAISYTSSVVPSPRRNDHNRQRHHSHNKKATRKGGKAFGARKRHHKKRNKHTKGKRDKKGKRAHLHEHFQNYGHDFHSKYAVVYSSYNNANGNEGASSLSSSSSTSSSSSSEESSSSSSSSSSEDNGEKNSSQPLPEAISPTSPVNHLSTLSDETSFQTTAPASPITAMPSRSALTIAPSYVDTEQSASDAVFTAHDHIHVPSSSPTHSFTPTVLQAESATPSMIGSASPTGLTLSAPFTVLSAVPYETQTHKPAPMPSLTETSSLSPTIRAKTSASTLEPTMQARPADGHISKVPTQTPSVSVMLSASSFIPTKEVSTKPSNLNNLARDNQIDFNAEHSTLAPQKSNFHQSSLSPSMLPTEALYGLPQPLSIGHEANSEPPIWEFPRPSDQSINKEKRGTSLGTLATALGLALILTIFACYFIYKRYLAKTHARMLRRVEPIHEMNKEPHDTRMKRGRWDIERCHTSHRRETGREGQSVAVEGVLCGEYWKAHRLIDLTDPSRPSSSVLVTLEALEGMTQNVA